MTQHQDDLKLAGEVAESQLAIAANVFVKTMLFKKAGDVMLGHKHSYKHVSLLSSGAITASCGDITKDFQAPTLIVTPAGMEHKFVALEDNTVMACIHALRDDNEEIIPEDSTLQYALSFMPKLTMP
jgi:quercetin dioxygenase-like cupin family protein